MRILFLVALLTVATNAKAQRGNGSLYSGFGIGLLNHNNVGQSIAMGGAGVAVKSPFFLNHLNPSAGSSINRGYNFLMEAEVKYNLISISTASQKIKVNRMDLSSIALWFRVSGRSSVSFGTIPMSSVDNSFLEKTYFQGSAQPYNKLTKNYGDLNKAYVNYSFGLSPSLSLGTRVYYGFGKLNKEQSYDLSGISMTSTDVFQLTEATNYSGVGLDLGLQYTVVSQRQRSLALGLVYQKPMFFAAKDLQKIYVANTGETLYENEKNPVAAPMHSTVTGGLAYHTSQWTFAADYSFKQYPDSWVNSPSSSGQVNVGVNYFPWRMSYGLPRQLDYSGGLFYDAGDLVFQGSAVKRYGMAMGVGIPLHNFSRLNISYQWQKQGAIHLLSNESSHGVSVTFRFADTWFQRPNFQ